MRRRRVARGFRLPGSPHRLDCRSLPNHANHIHTIAPAAHRVNTVCRLTCVLPTVARMARVVHHPAESECSLSDWARGLPGNFCAWLPAVCRLACHPRQAASTPIGIGTLNRPLHSCAKRAENIPRGLWYNISRKFTPLTDRLTLGREGCMIGRFWEVER